ncbi:MAG: dihydrofolate reductase [Methylophilaceae bacterium]
MQIISLIVAMAKNRVIGINNTLPWHLPEDLKRFRALTTGHHIIMGRKTYESLGRLLPNRVTVIVTRNHSYIVDGALVAHSLEAAIKLSKNDDEVFIIGGAELYQEGLKVAQRLYITEVDLEVKGDAFFPDFDLSTWEETARATHASEKGFEFNYLTYKRI